MAPKVAILMPAAGQSRRMRGVDKLIADIDGQPLLRRQAARAVATGATVIVLLPSRDHPRAAALDGLSLVRLAVPDAAAGMGATLRSGVAALDPDTDGAMILPADMPDLETQDLVRLLDRFATAGGAAIIRAVTPDGRSGHPVLFPRDLFAAFRGLSDDAGARSILAAHPSRVQTVTLDGMRALTDLDTPEAWAAWRTARER